MEGYTSANPIDNTFLVFKDLDGIVGVEADIWLPENAPVETAVLLGIADGGTPLGSLDLWNNNGNAVMYIDLENFETNEVISNSRNSALGTKYRVGLVKDGGKTKLLLDGEKVAEVTTTHSENINLLFRGESDATDPVLTVYTSTMCVCFVGRNILSQSLWFGTA